MKFDKRILESFLWETHGIEKALQARKFIVPGSEQEKITLCHKLTLNNLFLYRRMRDPGFYQHVIEEIENQPAILEKTVAYIYSLLEKHVFEDDVFNFSSVQHIEEKIIPEDLHHGAHEIYGMNDYFDASHEEIEISKEYFNKRYSYAIEKGLHDEAEVISSLLDDYKSGCYCGFKIFSSRSEFLDDNARWFSESMESLFQAIRCPQRYIQYPMIRPDDDLFKQYNSPKITDFDVILFRLLPLNKNILEFFSERLGILPLASSDRNTLQDIIRAAKFSTDVLSIAAEIWFSSLAEEKKIALLNDSYEFNLMEEHIASLDFPLYGFNGQVLFLQGYFNEAKLLYEQGLKNSQCDEERYSFASNLATTYRELGNYQKALEYYLRGSDYLRNIKFTGKRNQKGQPKSRISITKTRNPHHRQAIELLNVAEMKIQTGDSRGGKEDIATVRSAMRKFSQEERAHILSKLASLHRRTGNYLGEYLSLKELRNFDAIMLSPELESRWKLLTLPKAMSEGLSPIFPGGFWEDLAEHSLQDMLGSESGKKSIQGIENIRKAEEYMQKSVSAFNSFRLRASLEYCQKAIEMDRHPHLLSEAAYRYMELGEYASAVGLLDEAIANTHDPNLRAKCMTFFALIEIDRNDANAAILRMRDVIADILDSDLEDDEIRAIIMKALHQFCKHLVQKECTIPITEFVDEMERFMKISFSAWDVSEMISSAFFSVFALDESLHYIDSFLIISTISDEERAKGFRARGKILAVSGDHEEALKSYLQSRDCYLNSESDTRTDFFAALNAEIAYSYGVQLDLVNGLRYIESACEILPDRREYKEIRDKFSAFLRDRLSIQSIKDMETRMIFNTAEHLATDVYDKIDEKKEYDFSPAVVEYAKGLEKILYVNVQPIVSKEIIREFSILTKDDLYKSPLKNIPFKKAFLPDQSRMESITPHQWEEMKNHADEKNNQVDTRILEILEKRFGSEISDAIFKACEAVSLLDRNGAAHIKVKTKDDVLTNRKKIIEPLNSLIMAFYSSSNGND